MKRIPVRIEISNTLKRKKFLYKLNELWSRLVTW
jgi:hypothetical protein